MAELRRETTALEDHLRAVAITRPGAVSKELREKYAQERKLQPYRLRELSEKKYGVIIKPLIRE